MTYKDLKVWEKSMELVSEIYRLVKLLPKEEHYVLSDQMRRAAISIPSNIAEGYERYHTKEYLRFLMIARGSKAELETQLLICEKLNLLPPQQTTVALSLCDEIGRMLNAIKDKLQ
ncbi:MAG: four helix bundle protein [Clostridia bacterium]|nr:four helix bundle protein [Clostridia bacterium]